MHRHAAEAADNMSSLTDMVSLPIVMKVISATMRPTVAIKIPEVDDMLARAQEKVEAIRRAKQKTGELRPIDEVIFAQNVPQYNPEWEHAANGRSTSYLATLVCRYMHELQQKDTKNCFKCKGIGNDISYSKQFNRQTHFWKTISGWLRLRASS